MSRQSSRSHLIDNDTISLMVVGMLLACVVSAMIGQFSIATAIGAAGFGLAGLSAARLKQPVTLNLKER
jgi:hypothetical protein